MRSKLKPFVNFRANFTGTYLKSGINQTSGGVFPTLLLVDIKNSFGDDVSDHLWIREVKEFNKFNPKLGDKFAFSGVVKEYKRGYEEKEIDYKIIHIKNVKKTR